MIKGTVHPITCHEGTVGEQIYSCILVFFVTLELLDGVVISCLSCFTPSKEPWHPLYPVWHLVKFFLAHMQQAMTLGCAPPQASKIKVGLNHSCRIQFVIQMDYVTRITLLLTVKCNTKSLKHLNDSKVDWHCRIYTSTGLQFKSGLALQEIYLNWTTIQKWTGTVGNIPQLDYNEKYYHSSPQHSPIQSWTSKLLQYNSSHTSSPVIQVCKHWGMIVIMCKALTAFILEVGRGGTHCTHIFKLAMEI